MNGIQRALVMVVLGLSAAPAAVAQEVAPGPDSATAAVRIDSMFARYGPATPGVAVRVIRDGRIVFASEYGMAHLEEPAPITPATRFAIGSNSKQFTAFAIDLLAREGRLDLDADVHEYVPEVPDFGARITIRQLLHHQSGIHDWVHPFFIAGYNSSDKIDFDTVMEFLRRQRRLNFPPGANYTYSNTGYVLLAEVVSRVTGTPFPSWMRDHVFAPFGLSSARVRDNYRELIPHFAESYEPDGNGSYGRRPDNLTAYGSCCIAMTADDLARWASNLETAAVDGDVIRTMEGDVVPIAEWDRLVGYGHGLMRFDYHGHTGLFHSGQWVGFRSAVLVVPEEHFAVVALGNAGSTTNLHEWDILDLYLGNRNPGGPPAVPQRDGDGDEPGEAATAWNPGPDELQEYVGTYYSPELETALRFEIENGRLTARQIRWGGGLGFTPLARDEFRADATISHAGFFRENDRIVGLVIDVSRATGLRFDRLPENLCGESHEIGFSGLATFDVQVRDRGEAIRWFSQVLGFEHLFTEESMNWSEVRSPVHNVTIGIEEIRDRPIRTSNIDFGVRDIELARGTIEARGGIFVGETTDYGPVLIARLRDPSGNMYNLFQGK